MNQAIQFPDREEWDENKKCVCFPALVNGMQLTCAISGESLAYRFTGDTPEQWLASFVSIAGIWKKKRKTNSGTK